MLSKKERSDRVKGYEPNPLLPVRFLAMELGGRSKSVPSGNRNGIETNPFWSQRARDECVLRASRPSDLPQEDVSIDGPQQHSLTVDGSFHKLSDMPTGKGRGNQSAGVMPVSGPTVDRQQVLQTEGQIPKNVKKEFFAASETGQRPVGELQRALEVEVVDLLRKENSKLAEEVEYLRSQLKGKPTAGNVDSGVESSPWSAVEHVVSGQNSESKESQQGRLGRSGSRTPRNKKREVAVSPEKLQHRYTPNGTRVPDGPPPKSRDDIPLPPVPPFPGDLHEHDGNGQHACTSFVSGLYDSCDLKPRGKGHGGRCDDGVPSASEAKQLWLEREVKSLKQALDRVAVPQMLQQSEYWAKGDDSRIPANPSGQSGMAATGTAHGCGDQHLLSGVERLQDRAEQNAAHGRGVRHLLDGGGFDDLQVRAQHGTAHGDEVRHLLGGCGPDPHQGRAQQFPCGSPDLPHQGRAQQLFCGSSDLPHQGRAQQLLCGSSDLPQQARAQQVSGSAPGVFQGDRAFGAAESLHHGGSLWQPPGERRGQGQSTYGPVHGSWNDGGGGGSGGSKAELPDLPSAATPLEFGDWLHLCGPIMKDLSNLAGRWWFLTMTQAQCFYNEWKEATPLQRVQISPKLPEELHDAVFARTEQRGVHLLLKAVSADQQQELVVDRDLNSTAILYRLYIRHQPGGPGEKSILLKNLTVVPSCKTAAEWTAALRSWRRHYGRAREIGAVIPDGCLLIKALEPVVQFLAKEDSQASFRLAQSRAQLQVDERPDHVNIWQFSQCLLAECETLTLFGASSKASTTTSSPIKIKQLEATPSPKPSIKEDKQKGKGTSNSTKPCRYFASDAGCRAGATCKWAHDWQGLPDKNNRCWACGSKDHRKLDCPTKGAGGKTTKPGEPSGSGGDGNGVSSTAGQSSTSTTTSTKPTPKINEMSGAVKVEEVGSGGRQETGELEGSSKGDGGGSTGGSAGDALIQEATKLLKSLRIPQVKVVRMSQMHVEDGKDWVRLDSGATHSLRPAMNDAEWRQAEPTEVSLADGVTQSLRLKPGTRCLLSNPQDEKFNSWILPLGGLADMGFKFEWSGQSSCALHDPAGDGVEVRVHQGCPMVSKENGEALMMKLERFYMRMVQRWTILNMIRQDPKLLTNKLDVEMALNVKMMELWPSLPKELAMRLVPNMADVTCEPRGLPWNRAKRKRLRRAKHIVLHFFSGPNAKFWEKELCTEDTEVLCIDLISNCKADLLDDKIYKYLLMLASTGKVREVLGGPPCRTVSALRFQDDGGPGIIRTESDPYGVPGISPEDQTLVTNDALLFLRMLFVYAICEDVRPKGAPSTGLTLEQPEDPARYRNQQEVQEKQFMSVWRTPEWQQFQQRFEVDMIHFDQGQTGHKKRKPTTLALVGEELVQLDGLRCGADFVAGDDGDRKTMTMSQRCADSRSWAEWSPGLKAAIAEALRQRLQECHHQQRRKVLLSQVQQEPDSVRPEEPVPKLQPLGATALQAWRNHYLNDHMPARRDCQHCVRSQARAKPHKRILHPEAYTLAVDLSGKLTSGMNQERKQCSYLLVGVYTFPVTKDGKSLLAEDPQDHQLPDPAEFPGEEEEIIDDDPPEDPLQEQEEAEIPGEGEDGGHLAEAATNGCLEAWNKLVEESKNVAVKNVTMVEVVESRNAQHILPAIARIYSRLRQLGLPVLRLHSDRAREFTSIAVRRWAQARDIVVTKTSGDNYKANGRCEGALGQIKRATRTVLSAGGHNIDWWPLAAKLWVNESCALNYELSDILLEIYCSLVLKLLHCENGGIIDMNSGEISGSR